MSQGVLEAASSVVSRRHIPALETLYNSTDFHMNQNQMQHPEKSFKGWTDLVCESLVSLKGSRYNVVQPLSSPQEHRRAGRLFHALQMKS